jgi:YspA, cpYpsA-related SLOG family
MKTVLICGDRNWTDRITMKFVLEQRLAQGDRVIHGAAAGADTMAGEIAKELGCEVEAVPARWNQHGKAAGPIRNREMLMKSPGLVLAFHYDLKNSRGTKNMIAQAKQAHVPVVVFDKPVLVLTAHKSTLKPAVFLRAKQTHAVAKCCMLYARGDEASKQLALALALREHLYETPFLGARLFKDLLQVRRSYFVEDAVYGSFYLIGRDRSLPIDLIEFDPGRALFRSKQHPVIGAAILYRFSVFCAFSNDRFKQNGNAKISEREDAQHQTAQRGRVRRR